MVLKKLYPGNESERAAEGGEQRGTKYLQFALLVAEKSKLNI